MNMRAKLIGTIVVGAVSLAPAAQAQHPDDQPGPRGPGGIAALQAAASSHPDSRAGTHGPGALAVQQPQLAAATRPDDRADARGPGALARAVVLGRTSSRFDWEDALIGAVGGMGAALLLTGCLVLLLAQRSRARMA
jgi:hypothetical protein